MTPHNNAKKEDIAKVVIMPGDPLRAKFIAEEYLEDYKLVNSVRNMLAYTGKYKGKEITVMGSGMGMPSMGIYSYELYTSYDVDTIIRIGSCGAYVPELELFDVILAEKVHTEGNYALTFNNDNCHLIDANIETNNIIEKTARKTNKKLVKGNTTCTDMVDFYMPNSEEYIKRLPQGLNMIAAEMEAFALLYNAQVLNKKAACMMSVVDSRFSTKQATTEERQLGLTNMIELALDSTLEM